MSESWQVFVALDPVLAEPFDSRRERTLVRVDTKALHDLMLAYQVHMLAAGYPDMLGEE